MNATPSRPGAGRRVASRSARTSGRPGPLAGVSLTAVVVAGLLAGSASLASPDATEVATGRPVPVDQVTAGCVPAPAPGTLTVSTLAAPLTGTPDGGTLAAGAAGQPSDGERPPRRGVLERLAPDADTSLVVAADGATARGRATFRVDRPRGVRAVSVAECPAPRSRWWFTGAGAGLDHTSSLVLLNVDPGPAVVDVLVHGEDGPVDSVGTRGVTVPAGGTTTVDLVDVAPQADELAVHVEASRGRVVAAVADRLATEPGAGAGLAWLPAHDDAARVVRLAPLPARADGRALVVTNPSGREALVGVQVAGESGTFAPTGLDQLRVPPGSVVTVDLAEAVGEVASAVVLTSPVPVTAAVRSTRGEDVEYAGPAPVLRGPAAALVAEGTTATVQLTAGDDGGSARVVGYTADGRPVDETVLDVEPGTTGTWSPGRRVAYLVLTPVAGRVFGGVSLAGDAGLGALVLRPLPTVQDRPSVVPVLR